MLSTLILELGTMLAMSMGNHRLQLSGLDIRLIGLALAISMASANRTVCLDRAGIVPRG